MIDRRDFFKITGLTAFTALFGGCEKTSRTIVPFIIPPENFVLGESLWYATGCRQCSAGCGILVRISEGRAKKIEGNPKHPVNRGKLCARGQAAVQALYHPERLRQPLKRTGPRGSGAFSPISWQEALGLLVGALETVRTEAPESLLMLTGPLRGHRNVVADRFMKAFGSPARVAWDPLGHDTLLAASEATFGLRDIPEYDLAGARYALSFGGDFLETGLSPVHFGRAYGEMRQGRKTVRGKLAHFGSRFSMTASNADVYFPVAPGTEGIAALAIAHVLVKEKLTPKAAAATALWNEGLKEITPEMASQMSGLRPSAFIETAREFAENQPGLALAGSGPAGMTNGTYNLSCVALLNVLAGNRDIPGGISFPDRRAPLSRFGADAVLMAPPPESGHKGLRAATARMKKGEIRAALLLEPSNPAFALPPSLEFGKALDRVPFIAAMAPFLDETTSHADLILPTSHFLEEWGDDVAPMGHAGNAITLMQPVISVYHDTRSMPDILLAVAKELGGKVAAAFPAGNFRDYLSKAYAGMGIPFEQALQEGGFFGINPGPSRSGKASKPSFPKGAAPSFDGDPGKHPFVLRLYPSNSLLDGRFANLPWLQELPDPVTTAVWRNWIEINPETAVKLGIAEGDGVAVTSPTATIHAHAVLHPGLAPGVVAMPLGQGHRAFGKFANGRGENPFALLPDATDATTGAPAYQSTRVSLSKVALKGRLVRFGFPEGQWKPDQFIS